MVRLWERATGRKLVEQFAHSDALESAVFGPAGARILVAGQRHPAAYLWNRDLTAVVGSPLVQEGSVRAVAISPDGLAIATAGRDDTVRVWSVARGLSRPVATPARVAAELPSPPRASHQLADWHRNQTLVYGPESQILLQTDTTPVARLRETATGRPLGAPLRHSGCVRAVALSPDERWAATASHERRRTPANFIHLWDAATGRPRWMSAAQPDWVSALAFSPDGRVLATGGYDARVLLWDVATGRPLGAPLVQPGIVFSLAFSPDGRSLAVGCVQTANEAVLWDLPSRRRIGQPMRHDNWVAAIRFSPDGQTLVTRSNDRSVGLWDAATAAPRGPRLEHEGLTSAVAISPNGRLLATGSVDCTVRIWDARAGRVSPRATLAQIEAVTALAFSPNGRMLGIGLGNGAAAIYDLDLLKPLGPPMVQQSVIEGVAFTADGRRLVTTGRDGTTRSWPIPAPCGDDLDRIAMRLQVRTAMRGVANGQAVEPLEAPAWEASRRRLIDLEGSADSAYESLVSDQEYHDARARDAEQDGNIFAAIWHLDRLLAFADRGTADLETSPRWLLHARRARAQATAGRFEPADADYAEAERLASRTLVLDWYRHCVVDCEDIRNWTAAVWYLDRLIAAQPGDWRAYERRAQAYGQLGREDARRSDLARAIELGADPRLLDQNTPK